MPYIPCAICKNCRTLVAFGGGGVKFERKSDLILEDKGRLKTTCPDCKKEVSAGKVTLGFIKA